MVGPLLGPIVAVISFVCSVGNVPLAAVLWNGGISFGGVVAFLFADLIVLPILDIYRKYYGARVAALLSRLFYAAMAGAGYIVELVFGALGLVPGGRRVQVLQGGLSWNYTTVLDIASLALSAVLVWRFLRTGGPDMLRMMGTKGGRRGTAMRAATRLADNTAVGTPYARGEHDPAIDHYLPGLRYHEVRDDPHRCLRVLL